MSKVKANKTDSSTKTQQLASKKKNNIKQKKKHWFEKKFKKKKVLSDNQGKDKAQQMQPPKDAQQFSANWKILQEVSVCLSNCSLIHLVISSIFPMITCVHHPQMLKARQPEKKQPVTQKHLNGHLHKKETSGGDSKNVSTSSAVPKQTAVGKKGKHKTVSNSVIPKDSGAKVPAALETRPSPAPKRKGGSGTSNSEQASKKKKSVVKETKPTE